MFLSASSSSFATSFLLYHLITEASIKQGFLGLKYKFKTLIYCGDSVRIMGQTLSRFYENTGFYKRS